MDTDIPVKINKPTQHKIYLLLKADNTKLEEMNTDFHSKFHLQSPIQEILDFIKKELTKDLRG